MQRRSYYPSNQHIISLATATSSGLASSRPGTPANDLRVENSALRVEGSDMMVDPSMMYRNSQDMDLRPSADNGYMMGEKDLTRPDPVHLEKSYP